MIRLFEEETPNAVEVGGLSGLESDFCIGWKHTCAIRCERISFPCCQNVSLGLSLVVSLAQVREHIKSGLIKFYIIVEARKWWSAVNLQETVENFKSSFIPCLT